MRLAGCAIAILIAACLSPLEVGPLGSWGSTQADLRLQPSGGTLTYPCASGTVDAGWTEASDGSWSATGTHNILYPLALGTFPATYAGQFNGDQLDFHAVVRGLPGGGTLVLGPFHLVRDGPGVARPAVGCPL